MTSAAKRRALGFHDYREITKLGSVKRGASIEELAAVTDLPVEALNRTMEDVRSYAAGEKPDPLGRDFTQQPPLSPPYLAAKINGALSIRKADLSWTRRPVFSRPAALHCRTSLPEAARRAVSQGLPRGATCLEMDCCRRRFWDAWPASRRRGSSPRSPNKNIQSKIWEDEMKRVLVIVPFAMSDDEIGQRKDS